MKPFVRLPQYGLGVLIGLGSLLLVGVIKAETAVSYLAVATLSALLVRGEWIRRRREKDEATKRV